MTRTYEIISTRNLELITLAVYDAIKKIKSLSKHLVAKAPSGVKQLLGALLYVASVIGLRRLQRNSLDAIIDHFKASERISI